MRKLFITVCCLLALAFACHSVRTEQGGEKKEAKRKFERFTPRLHWGSPKNEIMDALELFGKVAEELQTSKVLCELMLGHTDPEVRIEAARTLGKIGVHPYYTRDATYALRDHLRIEFNDDVKVAILFALREYRPHTKDQIPLFVGFMKNANPKIRRAALVNIVGLLPENKQLLLPVMIAALDDPDVGDHPVDPDFRDPAERDLNSVSCTAMFNLRNRKIPVKEALPKLIQLAKDNKGSDGYQRTVLALLAFSAPEDPFVRGLTRSLLKDRANRTGLARGIRLCGELSATGKEFVPDLIPILGMKFDRVKTLEREIQEGAVGVLGGMGPEARQALPVLRALLERTEEMNFQEALKRSISRIEGNK